jgi:phenylacetate-CoA ligase
LIYVALGFTSEPVPARGGSVGDLLAIALLRLGAQPIKHGVVRDISETLDVTSQKQVNGLVGIPTQVLALARYGEGLKLKSALLCPVAHL